MDTVAEGNADASGATLAVVTTTPDACHDPHWLDRLGDLFRSRQIAQGIASLDAAEPLWSSLQVPGRTAAELLLALAQWVDVGYRDPQFLRCMLDRLPGQARLHLDVGAYLRVRMAEAFHALAVDDAEAAIRTLDVVLRLEADVFDPELAIAAHLWKGRAHRKKADYEQALHHIYAARELERYAACGFDIASAIR